MLMVLSNDATSTIRCDFARWKLSTQLSRLLLHNRVFSTIVAAIIAVIKAPESCGQSHAFSMTPFGGFEALV